ncbi:MAG: 16S rRNA (uracil(1498)-N(3))-methyltransferase [Flavobacteriaceae bacterium]|nr:16S rRNA (uracil(1498)-N(3))-methyltransferase [Flavobacteriaceae bacterium]
MQLFYNAQLQASDSEFTFDKVESKHIVRVLRKKEGDELSITNGKGYLFSSKIISASDKKCQVAITEVEEKQKARKYHLHIAMAPTKNNDRFEWFLEKATEIGIDEITPLLCDRSERKVVKAERFQKIIESAGKQSLKFYFPKLNEPVKFTDFVKSASSTQKFIAHCQDDKKRSPIEGALEVQQDVLVLIGPEGDFSISEIENALESGFKPVSLGKSRLRTETAGLVATHTISLVNNLK